jgi:hypothetical protein
MSALGLARQHGRLLRIELRRSTMLLILPLVAVLLGFTELRNDLMQAPLWAVRSTVFGRGTELPAGIVAGVAAWIASRDGRRHVTDLIETTARSQWARRLAAWAALTVWAMLLYAAYVAVVFVVTARQATWGAPIWWPAAVGAAAILACSAIGYAAGALVPGRFTAPVVAVVALLAPQIGVIALQHDQQWGRVSPVEDSTVPGSGVFFPFHAGLSVVQLILLIGVTLLALSAFALPGSGRGLRTNLIAALIALVGIVAVGTGLTLANTASSGAEGIVIPALHHTADDTPLSYVPSCEVTGTVPICLHPAFASLLPDLAASLDPVLDQVAGLPGAPVRVTLGPVVPHQQSGDIINVPVAASGMKGSPPVLYLSPDLLTLPGGATFDNGLVPGIQQLRLTVAATVISTVIGDFQSGTDAQKAVATALWIDAAPPAEDGRGGVAPSPARLATGSAALAAAHRFAALPATSRHGWLAANLTALRQGQITVAQVP